MSTANPRNLQAGPGFRAARSPRLRTAHYFLIPRSAEVSASMKAGRENNRSAYFMRGAAGLGSAMPY